MSKNTPINCSQITESLDPGETEQDLQLVERMIEGDERALEELIRRHSAQVVRVCRRICFDEAEVHSIVSDVFWEIWSRANTFDSTRGSVRTFLLLIARSKSIDNRRATASRQRVRAKLAEFSPTSLSQLGRDHPSAESIRLEFTLQVQTALKCLPSTQREAIELAFFKGYSHDEVARQLNTPLGTIKSRIRTGLRQLKRSLPDDCSS